MSGKFYWGNPCNDCPLQGYCDSDDCGVRYDLVDDMAELDGLWSPKVAQVINLKA